MGFYMQNLWIYDFLTVFNFIITPTYFLNLNKKKFEWEWFNLLN